MTAEKQSGKTDAVAYRVEGVAFSYGSRRGPAGADADGWALRGLTCDVHEGEILGIIGPNGSGKSTLLKLLGSIMPPQQGTIRLQGRPLNSFARQELARIVAYVPQQSSVVFPFTLAEFVLMGRFPHRQSGGALGWFGWETAEDVRVAGQSMEVLDLRHQVDICAILRRLNREQGLTVVLVSHDLNLASQSCDRLLLLQEGALIRLGVPSAVLQPEVIESVYRCPVLIDRHPASGVPRVTLP